MADLQPGTVLGDRFEVVGVLGHGGMATVYLVQDRVRGESAALKVLHGHLARSASMRARLRREVLTASRLRHPHALVAWDLHDLDGVLAVSMPLHRGVTLGDYVEREGPLTGSALRRLALHLAGALREAHSSGIVHRDVTPQNVMVDDDGRAVLTDFGLARFTDQRTATATSALGTPGYAAPEVYENVRSDPRSDLYSLGCVLYKAATGMAPFQASDPMGTLRRQMVGDYVHLRTARPDLPADLTGLVDALLRTELDDRPQGAADVLATLEGHRPPPAPQPARQPTPARSRHLPPGTWTVVVEEGRRDRERRRALRRRVRRGRGTLEDDVNRAVDGVKRWVMTSVLGVSEGRTPEQQLADAVAIEADLPKRALEVAPAMAERRFRLVESVSEHAALRLTEAAENAGFRARPSQVSEVVAAPRGQALKAVAPLMAATLVGAVVLGATGLVPQATFEPLVPLFFFVFLALGVFRRRGEGPALPVAYGRDLRFHLSPDSPVQLSAPRDAEPTPSARPAPSALEAPRHVALERRASDQLDALGQAIEGASDRLPALALSDLRGTLKGLRQQVDDLARSAGLLDAELARLDDTGAGEAVDRIESRIERLRTLGRAGSDSGDEVARLEAALAAHRATLEQTEAVEGRLTLVFARLLETGAAAARARLTLIEDSDPARSATDLLARLKEQTAQAGRALDEVGPRLRKEPPEPSTPRRRQGDPLRQ